MNTSSSEAPSTPPEQSRRRFLLSIISGVFAGIVALISGSFLVFLWPSRKLKVQRLGWERVCLETELVEAQCRRVIQHGRPVFVIKINGELKAFDAVCPHLGCIVTWDSDKLEFPCPCHDSQFTTEGKPTGGPATQPLTAYQVRVEEGVIYVGGPLEQEG